MALACLWGAEGCHGVGGWSTLLAWMQRVTSWWPAATTRDVAATTAVQQRRKAATDTAEAATRAALLRGWPFRELGRVYRGSRWPSSSTPYSKKSRKWTTEKWSKRCDLCCTSREGTPAQRPSRTCSTEPPPFPVGQASTAAPIFRAPGTPTAAPFVAALQPARWTRSALCGSGSS